MTKLDLRQQIERDIARAIDSSVNYSGDDYDMNKANWIQITTDRAIAAFVNALPEPVDVEAKYELLPGHGPAITVKSEQNEDENHEQMVYLARYADDRGYNRYHLELMGYLQGLYNPMKPVVQSEHDDSKDRPQREETDEPEGERPSKVR